jgi:hypothetical protein
VASELAPSASSVPATLLDYVADPLPASEVASAFSGVMTARVAGLRGRRATVRLRRGDVLEVELASEVDAELVALAVKERQLALVECVPGQPACLVGVLQTRLPKRIELRAQEVEIEASQSLTLKSGRAGLRLRSDGQVEIVGSRISAASRGLMRLVGRVLRLN